MAGAESGYRKLMNSRSRAIRSEPHWVKLLSCITSEADAVRTLQDRLLLIEK